MLQQKINVLKNSKNKILIWSAEGRPNKRPKIWFKKIILRGLKYELDAVSGEFKMYFYKNEKTREKVLEGR